MEPEQYDRAMPIARDRLALDPIIGDAEVGRWLAALQDSRARTLRELSSVGPELVDRVPDGPLASIGTLLYHIALIEADWVAGDILGLDEPPALVALLPWPDRAADGRLHPVTGLPLSAHIERLAAVRAFALDRLSLLSAADLRQPRAMPDHDVTPDWVFHHLLQHEAEHRAQIAWIRDAAT